MKRLALFLLSLFLAGCNVNTSYSYDQTQVLKKYCHDRQLTAVYDDGIWTDKKIRNLWCEDAEGIVYDIPIEVISSK